MQTRRFHWAALIKAVLLLMFIVAAVVMVRFTGVREFLTVEKLGAWLSAAGVWAPLAFILVYAVGVCLFIPGTLLTALGAAIFGPYWGFIYVWVAAMLGAAPITIDPIFSGLAWALIFGLFASTAISTRRTPQPRPKSPLSIRRWRASFIPT